MKGIRRIVFVAFLGTFIEIVGLFGEGSYNMFLLLVHLLEIPFMMRLVLGKEHRNMLRVIITGYFFIMVINAVLEVLWNWFGEYGNYVFLLGASCSLVYMGVRIYQNYSRIQKGIFPIEIMNKGNQIFTYGFYDSGNRLIDPYTQKGVHIISEQLFKRIGLDNENAVLVPYQALGSEEGMVEVYYVEEMRIEGERQRKSWKKSPVGVTKENLFKEGQYEIILNEEVF